MASLWSVGLFAILLVPAFARADAIGPAPTAEDCPRGSVSAVANEMRHGQFAYCAPSVAPPEPACWEGHARVALDLLIAERLVWPSGGHGAPLPAGPSERLAEVTGACDAPDDETPITARPDGHRAARSLMGGPSTEAVPAGCHRVEVWVLDADVHCAPSEAPTEVAPPAAVPPAPAATEPNVAEEGPTRTTPALPAAEASPPVERPTAAAAPSTCACRASAARDAPWMALVALAWALALRRRRTPDRRRLAGPTT